MAARRILVEKSVLMLGKWDVTLLNEDVARVVDLESQEKKGTKIRLQLTTGGLQVARAIFQDPQPGDFLPISEILDIITGPHWPPNIQCFTRGTSSPFSVVVYECSSEYDSVEFADNYRRLRRTIGLDGHIVDVKRQNMNWTLTRPNSQLMQSMLYPKDRRLVNGGQGQYIVTAPNSGTVTANKRSDAAGVVVQNGSGHNHHARVVVNSTNGHVPVEKVKRKVKRDKSFKVVNSKGNSQENVISPPKESRVRMEKQSENFEQTSTHTNGVTPQQTPAEVEKSNAELKEDLQHVSEELKNIKLLLEKNVGVNAVDERGRSANRQNGSIEKRSSSSHRHTVHQENDGHHSHRDRGHDSHRKSKTGNAVVRTQSHRNGEINMVGPEYRGTGVYTIQRPVQIVHLQPGEPVPVHHFSQRTRAYSNGMDPRSPAPHGTELQYSVPQNAASMTLPRSYRNGNFGSPSAKHSPRVTFDENTSEEASRKSSLRSSSKTGSLAMRPADTVLRPIEKVYGNPNAYYVQPRTTVIGPGVRHVSNSGHTVYRRSSLDRENEGRNTSFENVHPEHENDLRGQYML